MSRLENFQQGSGPVKPTCLDCGRDLHYDRHWKDTVAEHRTPLEEVRKAWESSGLPEGIHMKDVIKDNYHVHRGIKKEIDLLERHEGWSHVGDGMNRWMHLGVPTQQAGEEPKKFGSDQEVPEQPVEEEKPKSTWEKIHGLFHRWADHSPRPNVSTSVERDRQVNDLIDAHQDAKFRKITRGI